LEYEDVEKPSKAEAPIATIVKVNVDKKAYICRFSVYLSVMRLSVKVDKYGRIVLPKQLREKYGVQEGFRLIVMEFMGRICLVPVKTYEKPTEALYGCVRLEKPIEEPKRVAREYIRKKLTEGLQ
jgi:AbrB family looped-hinge helix DNA binding protein